MNYFFKHFAKPAEHLPVQHNKQRRIPLAPIENSVISQIPDPDPEDVDLSLFNEIEEYEHYEEPRFLHVEFPIGNPDNEQDVTEYEHIIYRSMRERELKTPLPQVLQTDFTDSDVGIIIDSLDRIHFKFQLTTNTFYRCVGILQRVLAITFVSASQLPLVSCAALLVASKVEDVNPILASDIVKYIGNQFDMNQLLKMETDIYSIIGYDTVFPTPLFFLVHFLRLDEQTPETLLLSRYITELCMTCPEFKTEKPSAIAAAAIMMVRTIAGAEIWPEKYVIYTQYTFEDLCHNVKIIHAMLLQEDRQESRFMKLKYSYDIFHYVSSTVIPKELPIPYPYFE